MKFTVPALEIDPDEGFSPDKDIFERKQFGRNVLNINKKKCIGELDVRRIFYGQNRELVKMVCRWMNTFTAR